jgi:pyridoxamine 5'-phosphate oxidase
MSEWINKLRDSHADFDKGGLIDSMGNNPFNGFSLWFDEAIANNEIEVNACILSTVDISTLQSASRIVYLKELKNEQFIFYTNYNSQKGNELLENPKASLLFFWPGLQRQVRIEGLVEKVSSEESDVYFASRPRESQLGAWASNQSEILNDRNDLIFRLEELDAKYPDRVPRPPHWGGYGLSPKLIEFWQGLPSRLHDRLIFQKTDNNWSIFRKNP